MATRPQLVSAQADRAELEKFLDALDKLQTTFMEAFQHRSEFLDAHHWNVCKTFWRNRNAETPIEKAAAIGWRKSGDYVLVGENKARDHLDLLIKDGFLEEYFLPEINKRTKYVRGTDKLYDCLDRIFSLGVTSMKDAFR